MNQQNCDGLLRRQPAVSSAITSGESGVEAAATGGEVGDFSNTASNSRSPCGATAPR